MTARPVQLGVAEQLAGLAQLERDDRRRPRGSEVTRSPVVIVTPIDAGVALHRVDHHPPAADREPSRDLGVEQQPLGPLPHERRRQLAGIMVEGVDAGEPGEHRRGALVGVVGDPGAEVLLDLARPGRAGADPGGIRLSGGVRWIEPS